MRPARGHGYRGPRPRETAISLGVTAAASEGPRASVRAVGVLRAHATAVAPRFLMACTLVVRPRNSRLHGVIRPPCPTTFILHQRGATSWAVHVKKHRHAPLFLPASSSNETVTSRSVTALLPELWISDMRMCPPF